MRKIVVVLALFASIVFTSCTNRLGLFTVISTKNVDWSRVAEYKRDNRKVKGEDAIHIILFLPTKLNITIEDAVDQALEKVPGAVALTDVVLRSEIFAFPFFGKQAFVVEGNVLIVPKLVANDDSNKTIYYQGYYDKNKEFKLSKIEKTQFDSIQKDIAQQILN